MHSVLKCITFPEEPCKSGLAETYLNIFAKSIAFIVSPVAYTVITHLPEQSIKEVECYQTFRDAIHQNKLAELSIAPEMNLLQEIKDIQDELHLIQRVLDD